MFKDVVSGYAWAFSPARDAVAICDLTLTLPTTTGLSVYAELMLTTCSQGWDPQHVGSAATGIVRAAVMGPGGMSFIDMPADPMNNSAYFDKCVAVDFRLVCVLAEAYANANVWYHASPAPQRPGFKLTTLAYAVKMGGTNLAAYSRRIVGHRGFVPPPEDAERETLRRAARALDTSVRRLTISRARASIRPRRPHGVTVAQFFSGPRVRWR